MNRIILKHVALMVMFLAAAGCHMLQDLYLKSPTKIEPPKAYQLKHPVKSDESTAAHVEDMMNRTEIRFSNNVTNRDAHPILQECLAFLAKEFGTPVYRGRVVLLITDDPSDNAFITWSESDKLSRQITLNHYNIMKPMWHHYLVHELFHAFYQSSEFLNSKPDSIIEGLAIYAQYKYEYQDVTNIQIRKKLYEEAVSLSDYVSEKAIDFDRPFQAYGDAKRKYCYLMSGLLFFTQEPENVKAKIDTLLRSPILSAEKMSFEQIVMHYNLSLDDEMFPRRNMKALALPVPKEYTSPLTGEETYFSDHVPWAFQDQLIDDNGSEPPYYQP